MAEATARRKRQAATDMLKMLADHVNTIVANVTAATRPSDLLLERKVARLDNAWQEVQSSFIALRAYGDSQRNEENLLYAVNMEIYEGAKDRVQYLMIAGHPQQPAGPTTEAEVAHLEGNSKSEENLMDAQLLAI